MEKEGRLIELRDKNGNLIFSFQIVERPLSERPNHETGGENSLGAGGDGKPKNFETPMTDAQKKFLFRILADQGKENEVAHQHLKKYFEVESLKEVTKSQASQAIEHFLKESKQGAKEESKGGGGL